ncbi:hypothetical protein GOODEAATRI_007934 [Goodea atripinnis]|uniref:Uncharacterized protein n=1 Tax=Goodea atripinnis TaxID=208336 RepID=A0ABV0MZM2_9TELE
MANCALPHLPPSIRDPTMATLLHTVSTPLLLHHWRLEGQALGSPGQPLLHLPPRLSTDSPRAPRTQYAVTKLMLKLSFPLYDRHSPLEKSFHSSHKEPAVFKQPPPLEPPVLSPTPSLRDPPWPHGPTSTGRPSSFDKQPTQRKESSQLSAVMSHRVPRPYNKVASSK